MPADSSSTPLIDEKKAEIDLFIREKEALRRLRLERVIAGNTGLVTIVMPFFIAILVGVYIYFMGFKAGMNGQFVSALAVMLSAIFVAVQIESRDRNKQIAALKQYVDLKFEELEKGK